MFKVGFYHPSGLTVGEGYPHGQKSGTSKGPSPRRMRDMTMPRFRAELAAFSKSMAHSQIEFDQKKKGLVYARRHVDLLVALFAQGSIKYSNGVRAADGMTWYIFLCKKIRVHSTKAGDTARRQ